MIKLRIIEEDSIDKLYIQIVPFSDHIRTIHEDYIELDEEIKDYKKYFN